VTRWMRGSWPSFCAPDCCAVYNGENGLRTLRELARSYLTISKDQARAMNRLKALYRSWGIPCSGRQVYTRRHRDRWLSRIAQLGVRRRAELFYRRWMDCRWCVTRCEESF
jgi:hypothetical protein